MKPMKRILAAAMTLSLTACLAFPAFGAIYDVETVEDVQNAVSNPNKNTGDDKKVILNMKNSLSNVGDIDTRKDWTYTFQGNGNTLGGVTAAGEGTVTVNADVKADPGCKSVEASGNTTVTVNGNVEAANDGISVTDNANLTVNGSVSIQGYGTGVNASDSSKVTITGDVVSKYGDGAAIMGGANLTVKGKIDSNNRGLAVEAGGTNSAAATVEGGITAGDSGVDINVWDNASAKVTVNGSVTAGTVDSNSSGANLAAAGDSNIEYTQNGDVTSHGTGIGLMTQNKGSVKTEINGNVASEDGSLLDVHDHGSASLTVNGNTTVQNGSSAYELEIRNGEADCKVSLTHNGNITHNAEDSDAIRVDNSDYPGGTADVKLNGNVNLKKPDGGIRVNQGPSGTTNITVTSKQNIPVYSIGGADPDCIQITVNTPVETTETVPERRIPVTFRGEDLDGNQISSSEGRILLVYFDPADPDSISELQEGQKVFAEDGTVYAVCMTEDYEAAKAAMEKAEAEYPVLKLNEDLQNILTQSGCQAPVGLILENGELVLPEHTVTNTIYEVTHPEIQARRPEPV